MARLWISLIQATSVLLMLASSTAVILLTASTANGGVVDGTTSRGALFYVYDTPPAPTIPAFNLRTATHNPLDALALLPPLKILRAPSLVSKAYRAIRGEEKATKAGRTAVMGRDMGKRVIPYAERNGYDYYKGTPKFIPFRNRRLDLFFNKRWMNKQMRRQSDIVDIGEPPGMPSSPFYDMERQATRGYPKYREDPQP